MRCIICGKISKEGLCNKCFARTIEKRIRKYIRLNSPFRKNDRILVKGSLNKYLIPRIIKHLPCRICCQKAKGRINKIVVQWTLDDETNLFLKHLFTGKKAKQNPRHIKPLKVITDREAERFAGIKKLKFKPNRKDKEVQHFINEMEKSYPDTKYKIFKSIGILKCIKKSS